MAEYLSEIIQTLTEEMILYHINASSKNRNFSKVIFDQKIYKSFGIPTALPWFFSMWPQIIEAKSLLESLSFNYFRTFRAM